MEYIQGISTQTTLFLYSLALGFGLGVIYDVFRTLRMFVPRVKWLTVTADVLYFTLCGVISFFFMLVTGCWDEKDIYYSYISFVY